MFNAPGHETENNLNMRLLLLLVLTINIYGQKPHKIKTEKYEVRFSMQGSMPNSYHALRLEKNGSYKYVSGSFIGDNETILEFGTYLISDSVLTFRASDKSTEKTWDGNSYSVRKDVLHSNLDNGPVSNKSILRGPIKPKEKNTLILTHIQ
jgi:hypothetical protein